MKRDWNTVGRVLAIAEELDFDEPSAEYAKRDDRKFFYHARMLCAEGYLVCKWHEESDTLTIVRLTMKGHDLLERVRQREEGKSPLIDSQG